MIQRRSPGRFTLLAVLVGVASGIFFLTTREPDARPVPVTEAVETAAPQSTLAPTALPTAYATPIPVTISLPTLGVNAPIVEARLNGSSWDVTYLGHSAGHLQGTAWFDAPGNVVLAGHVELADGSAGIFASLTDLRVGDPIIVRDGAQTLNYAVSAFSSVAPDDLTPLYPTTSGQLTLITCSDYDVVEGVYKTREVVVARLV